jgi:alanine dehydrogenase
LDYAVKIADHGFADAVNEDAALALGVNTLGGAITCEPVASAHGLPYRPLATVLGP